MNEQRWPPVAWAAGGLLFVMLATANGAGYRYGTSDQAFYIPAIIRALNPASFPRDAALIDAQGRLMVIDEIVAALVSVTGAAARPCSRWPCTCCRWPSSGSRWC